MPRLTVSACSWTCSCQRDDPNGLCVVDVISGAWHSDAGKLEDHRRAQVFEILCRHGYTVFALRPGSVTKFTATEMRDNVHRGIAWIRQHAPEYEVSPHRLCLMGASAGGHLACLTALTASEAETTSGIAAVAVFFPPTDFLNYGGRRVDLRSGEGFGASGPSTRLPLRTCQ